MNHTNKQNSKTLTDEFVEQAQHTILQGIMLLVKQFLSALVRKANPDFDKNLANRGRNGR